MRTPGLRLRQVFEHGTHFKVQKPGGQTITIAKKGLSPSTVGRLRRFAQGGEVRGYDNGGEVSDPSQASFETAQAEVDATQQAADTATANAQRYAKEQAAMQPVQAERRRVVAAGAAQGTMDEDARRRMDFDRMRETPAAPAQPTIIINTTPAPTAQPQAMTAAPAIEQPAPAEVPAKRAAASVPVEEVPLPPSGITPEASVSPVFVKAPEPVPTAPTAPPMGRFLSRPGLLAPLPPPMTLNLPKTETPVEVAPAALPAAPVAPIAPAAFQALTAEGVATGFREAFSTDPKATIGQVVGQMLGSDATVPALVRPKVADIPAFQLMQRPDLLKAFTANIADGINAITEEGRADLAAGQIALDQLKQQELVAAEKAKRDVERKEEIQRHITEATSAAEAADDIKPFFSSGGIGSTIGNIIALAVGGFMSGYTGTPNYVYDAYSKAAARDLDEQRRRRDSRWNKVKTLLGDDKAADLMIQADNDLFTSIALKKASVQQNMLKVQPQIDKLAADFMAKAIQGYGALDLRMAQAEDEREKAPPRVVGRGGGRTSAASQTLEYRKQEDERKRTLSVGGIPVRASRATGATGVQEELDRRNALVGSFEKLNKLIETAGPKAWDLLAQERQDIISELKTNLENTPQAFGYKRAISVNAGKILDQALNNPTGLAAAMRKVFNDVDPASGVKKAIEEIKNQRRARVLGLADSTNQRDKDAAKYALWKLENEEAQAVGRKTVPAPKFSTPIEHIESLPPDSPLYQPAAGSSATAAPPPSVAKTFTITNTKTGQSRQTTDASMADKFRNQPGFTVVP